jgi:hypothetical protein
VYSRRIVEQNLERIERKTGLKLKHHERDYCRERTEELQPLWTGSDTSRALSRDEAAFIANEQILCALDFRYFFERYYTLEIDGVLGGGIGQMPLGEAQIILLDRIAKAQEEEYDKAARGETVDGVLIVDHKARQIWHTALCRAFAMHRAITMPHSRCHAGSVDDDKIDILYRRDSLAHEMLPWFLKPKITTVDKSQNVEYSTGSRIIYMANNKKSSFGQGDQFDLAHETECSEWPYFASITVDLLPALPQNKNTLAVLESRANGRNNAWHEFTEDVRHGRKRRWRYSFIPWYAEPQKYRRTPPLDWVPSDAAVLHAKKVHETSPEFVGKAVYLPREQLFWWETTREEYVVDRRLNYFLTNYCATPEESFQHSGNSAFDVELLDELRSRGKEGDNYEFVKDQEADRGTITIITAKPQDARGLIKMFEEPNPGAEYFMGVDPTRGIVNWDRHFVTDARADNGSIQILRKGKREKPDVQVAEYAAPLDPEELGDVANAMGRLYGGANEDGQALAIVEVWPGPGEPAQRRMIQHGYTNLYVPIRFANTLVPEKGRNVVGWVSNERSRRDLWTRGMKYLIQRKVKVHSPWLIEEMADCQPDDWMVTETARARYGKKDDRVVALLLAIYAAHDWDWDVETVKEEVVLKAVDWQRSAITLEDQQSAWEERWDQISG